MRNTWPSVFLVMTISIAMVMGIMAIIYRIPFLKRLILGEIKGER